MLANSIVSGVVSVPMDFYLGLERTFQDLNFSDGGRRIQSRNMQDDIRVGRAVYRAFKDRNEITKILTAPRPKGRGFPLHGAEPKPLYAIQDLQALRGLTLPARQLLY